MAIPSFSLLLSPPRAQVVLPSFQSTQLPPLSIDSTSSFTCESRAVTGSHGQ